MRQCPHCHRTENQVKNGKTQIGSQLYKCKSCNRKYTPEPKPKGYTKDKRQQAIRLVLDGNSQRQAARHTGVSHGTVANWFKIYADELPEELPVPELPVEVAEQDELFTFIGQKKRSLHHDHCRPGNAVFSQHSGCVAAQPTSRSTYGKRKPSQAILQRPISPI